MISASCARAASSQKIAGAPVARGVARKSGPSAHLPLDAFPSPLRSAEDVADAVCFLAAAPDYVTGTIVTVDGGASLGSA